MNVLHVIPSLSAQEGGPTVAVRAMASALVAQGVRVTVAATGDEDGFPESFLLKAPANQPEYRYFKRSLTAYKFSIGLRKWLRSHICDFDLVHIHALFSFSSTVAARIAYMQNIPYIIRPLGVLNRWGMENRRGILKKVSFPTVELPILLKAATIHYTSEAERGEAASLDPKLAKHRAVVIPLPVEPPAAGDAARFRKCHPELSERIIILFLSRLDPKKGLELLLDAFALVYSQQKGIALVVAGSGQPSYDEELRARKSTTENHDSIFWVGSLHGQEKADAFAAASVFVLPSFSENFGIAAAESLACGVPTIVSEEVGLSSDIRRYEAGVVVQRDKQELADAICDLLSDRTKAETLAANGRRLAQERYSPEAVGATLHQLYQAILE